MQAMLFQHFFYLGCQLADDRKSWVFSGVKEEPYEAVRCLVTAVLLIYWANYREMDQRVGTRASTPLQMASLGTVTVAPPPTGRWHAVT